MCCRLWAWYAPPPKRSRRITLHFYEHHQWVSWRTRHAARHGRPSRPRLRTVPRRHGGQTAERASGNHQSAPSRRVKNGRGRSWPGPRRDIESRGLGTFHRTLLVARSPVSSPPKPHLPRATRYRVRSTSGLNRRGVAPGLSLAGITEAIRTVPWDSQAIQSIVTPPYADKAARLDTMRSISERSLVARASARTRRSRSVAARMPRAASQSSTNFMDAQLITSGSISMPK